MLTERLFTFPRDGGLRARLLIHEILVETKVSRAFEHPKMTTKIAICRPDQSL